MVTPGDFRVLTMSKWHLILISFHYCFLRDRKRFLIFPANQSRLLAPLVYVLLHAGFPLGLENLEKWEGFTIREKSGSFNQTGKSGKIT